MTECVHKWYAVGNYSGGSDGACCGVKGCKEELTHEEVDRRLNTAERLREGIHNILRQLHVPKTDTLSLKEALNALLLV